MPMTPEGEFHDIRRTVKRKLFEDLPHTKKSLQRTPKKFKWKKGPSSHFECKLKGVRSFSDSDEEIWASIKPTKSLHKPEPESSTTDSSNSGSLVSSPCQLLFSTQQINTEEKQNVSINNKQDKAGLENESNFTWLLNFKVESLFQTPWDHPVNHDHNYRSMPGTSSSQEGADNEDFGYGGTLSYPRGSHKPPYTYTELIELALRDKGEITVSGIYKWIMDHFPFFKAKDDRWKNSVRHNLSINANFKKGRKAQGSSHLWTIASDAEKKLKQELISHATKNQWKRKLSEVDCNLATTNLSDFSELQNGENKENEIFHCSVPSVFQKAPFIHSPHNNHVPLSTSPGKLTTLTKSAEDILNGDVEKRVEVQHLTPLQPLAYTFLVESPEFLNPLSQKEALQESGLLEEATSSQVMHSLPQQIFSNLCSEMEPSVELFEDELALSYLNISP